jgi:hypothetical protein
MDKSRRGKDGRRRLTKNVYKLWLDSVRFGSVRFESFKKIDWLGSVRFENFKK